MVREEEDGERRGGWDCGEDGKDVVFLML